MAFVSGVLFILLSCSTSVWAGSPKWNFAAKKMVSSGLKKKFILELKRQYEPESFRPVVELNVLLYLKKADIHAIQVSKDSQENVRRFMAINKLMLSKAERDFGVSGSVIASLLWIESRHGQNTGQFHVPSVYVHLIQSDNKPVQDHLLVKAKDYKKKLTKKDIAEIKKRTKKKAAWALTELKALQKMWERDPKMLRTLRGSFSGAFGMAQFLPSSYGKYAVSSLKGKVPNLATAGDSIYSVGYYLKKHGWKQDRKKSHSKALFGYNNSYDYGNAILKLAAGVMKTPKNPKTPINRKSPKTRLAN